jgi:hypothetical protein
VGSNSRYDRDRPVGDGEARETHALSTISELLVARGGFTLDGRGCGQVAHVLDATALELHAGRGVPLEIRRAVRGLANELRVAMDPRTSTGDVNSRPGAVGGGE